MGRQSHQLISLRHHFDQGNHGDFLCMYDALLVSFSGVSDLTISEIPEAPDFSGQILE